MAKVNKSLYKIPLVGGIERIPAIILVVSLCIIVLYAPFYMKIAGVVIILLLWAILAKLNAYDCIFLQVLVNYVLQQKFYYAQAMETKRIYNPRKTFNP